MPSCKVWLLRGEGVALAEAATDLEGAVEIRAASQSTTMGLVAKHPDFLPLQTTIPYEAGRLAREFVLLRGGRVAGFVVGGDGEIVRTEPWVIAHLKGHPPSKADLHQAMVGFPNRVNLAVADTSGRFVVDGLPPGEEVSLLAAGGGVVSSGPHSCPVGSEDVKLVAEALFGLRVRFAGLSEGPVPLWSSPGPRWYWDPGESKATGIETDSLAAVLLGLELHETTWRCWNPLTLLFRGPVGVDSIGPIEFQGQIAGYDPIVLQLRAPIAREGIETFLVEPIATAAGWGDVKVSLRGLLPPNGPAPDRVAPLGVLGLRSLESGAVFDCPLLELAESSVVERVPYGLYEATISTESGYYQYPAVETAVSVTAAGGRVSFDMSRSCEVEIFVGRQGQPLFEGEVVVEVGLSTAEGEVESYTTIRRAPYVIQGLAPGRYAFRIQKPFFNGEAVTLDLAPESRTGTVVFLQE